MSGQRDSEQPKLHRRAPNTLTEAYAAGLGVQARRKYGNQPVVVDGHRFDSKREAARYSELVTAQRAGLIRDLEVHPRFPLVVHGQDCGAYVADFGFIDADGARHVEDVKSPATRKLAVYRFKARLLWALYGLRVEER